MDLAVARWRKSKVARTTDEQLIEIRIALESVLLSDDRGSGEKRHRLATWGAWLIGKTAEERQSYFETLKHVYDYASTVIHGGTLKVKGGRELARDVAIAQDLCRAALLRLAVDGIPDSREWSALVLGGGGIVQ